MSDTGYSIRGAKQADVDDILRSIKELPKSDNMGHVVKTSRKDLSRDMASWYSCIVVEYRPSDGVPAKLVGYAMWNYAFSTWLGKMAYLIDIYVSPDHRGCGCGSSLMQSVAKICREKGCKRIRWSVMKCNENAKKFYNKMNVQNLSEKEDWEMMHIEGEIFMELVRGSQKIPVV